MDTQIVEQQEAQDTEVEDCAEELAKNIQAAFVMLKERCRRKYAAAVLPLDAERDELAREQQSIEQTAQDLEVLLPAKARIAQYEADVLIVAGKHEQAREKIAEHEAAVHAPEVMKQRQNEISARIEAIENEKRAAAIRVFNGVYPEAQSIVRPVEGGLFITLLDGLKAFFIAFENQTCPARTVHETDSMVRGRHIEDLTAEERSDLWIAGNHWYGGRNRR